VSKQQKFPGFDDLPVSKRPPQRKMTEIERAAWAIADLVARDAAGAVLHAEIKARRARLISERKASLAKRGEPIDYSAIAVRFAGRELSRECRRACQELVDERISTEDRLRRQIAECTWAMDAVFHAYASAEKRAAWEAERPAREAKARVARAAYERACREEDPL
jgi:hypothetical protein